jgi:hypothetical protein
MQYALIYFEIIIWGAATRSMNKMTIDKEVG